METYLCQRGDPWSPNDLDRAMAEAQAQVPEDFRGTFNVDHWATEDAPLAGAESFLLSADGGCIRVQVFHSQVDPVSRVCELCGKTCGLPRARGGALNRLR